MMQSKLSLAVIGVLALAGAAQAAYTPIAVSGFNYDVIVEAGKATFALAQTATFDGGPGLGGNTFSAFGANPAFPTVGLPAGVFTSAADADHSFLLAAVDSNNAVQLSKTVASGTLMFSQPAAYSALSFLVSGGWGGGTVGYTITYADNSTAAGTIAVPDWSDTTAARVLNAGGRTQALTWDLSPAIGNTNESWGLFQVDVAGLSTSLNISKVDFAFVTTGNNTPAIFGVSGVGAVPEPTSLAVLGLASSLMLMRRRRVAGQA